MRSGMPSVSRFQSAHMPTGMNISRVIDNLSESDMDTCSDSEGECFGARYSLEASPQDDKVPNGGAKPNARIGIASGQGTYFKTIGRKGDPNSSVRHELASDESSESVTSSELNSTPSRGENVVIFEKKVQGWAYFLWHKFATKIRSC